MIDESAFVERIETAAIPPEIGDRVLRRFAAQTEAARGNNPNLPDG